jgi:hypothetical protein
MCTSTGIQNPDPDPHSFSKLDRDPHSPKKLDPDPHKVNADPKHWIKPLLLKLYPSSDPRSRMQGNNIVNP